MYISLFEFSFESDRRTLPIGVILLDYLTFNHDIIRLVMI